MRETPAEASAFDFAFDCLCNPDKFHLYSLGTYKSPSEAYVSLVRLIVNGPGSWCDCHRFLPDNYQDEVKC